LFTPFHPIVEHQFATALRAVIPVTPLLDEVMSSRAQSVGLAFTLININSAPSAGQWSSVSDDRGKAQFCHDSTPLWPVRPHGSQSEPPVNDGVRDLMCHGRGKVGVPVLNEGVGIETQHLNPSPETPLPGGAAAQVEPDLRCRQGSQLQIKPMRSLPYRPILDLVQDGTCHRRLKRSISCIFFQFLLHCEE
jgi:hypothetical protein